MLLQQGERLEQAVPEVDTLMEALKVVLTDCFLLTQCMLCVAAALCAAARDYTCLVCHIAEVLHLLTLQLWAACVQHCVKHVTCHYDKTPSAASVAHDNTSAWVSCWYLMHSCRVHAMSA